MSWERGVGWQPAVDALADRSERVAHALVWVRGMRQYFDWLLGFAASGRSR